MIFNKFKIRTEIKLLPLFLNESFWNVAVTVLALFSPIFIYKIVLGIVNSQTLALLAAVFFFFGSSFFKLISNLIAEEWSRRIGLKMQIYVGDLFLIAEIAFLFFAIGNPLFIVPASICDGFASGFYWYGRHAIMAKVGKEKSFGKELGLDTVLITAISLIAPIAGGIVINWLGYQGLFMLSILVIILAILVMRSSIEEKTTHDTDLKEIFSLYLKHPRMFLAYFGEAAAGSIGAVAFPLYIFMILKTEMSLGKFAALTALVSAIVSFFIGEWVDKRGKRQLIEIGSIVSALVWAGRSFTVSIPVLLFLSVVFSLFASMKGIPLTVLSYEKAVDDHATARAILFREVAICIGSMFACLFLAAAILSNIGLEGAFLLAAMFSLYPLLIARHG